MKRRILLLVLLLALLALPAGLLTVYAQDGGQDAPYEKVDCDLPEGEDPSTYFLDLADVARFEGDEDERLAYLDCHLRLKPEDRDARLARAMSLEALGLCRDALNELDYLIQKYPTDSQLYYAAWNCLGDVGTFAEIEANYTGLIALEPSTANYRRRADLYRDYDRRFAAVEDARRAAELDPDDPFTISYYGFVLNSNGFPEDARPVIERAIALDPEDDYNYEQRGINSYLNYDYEAALADFERAYAMSPSTFPLSWQAWIYTLMGDFETAADRFRDCLEIDPSYAFCYYDRAIMRYARGDFAAAENDFANGIRYAPGYAYSDQQDQTMRGTFFLIENYSQMLEVYPDNVYALYFRGRTYAIREEWREAILDFQRVIDLKPDLAVPYRSLGDVYYQQGRLDEAATMYNAYLEVAGSAADPFIEQRLDEMTD